MSQEINPTRVKVRGEETVADAMDRVYEFVEEQLIRRVQEIEADLSGNK